MASDAILRDDQGALYLVDEDTEDDPTGYPLATLWLPDPDTRHGWAMRHVWPRKAPTVSRARPPLGFGPRVP